MDTLELLKSTNFGERVAEEEADNLSSYFVETDNWTRLLGGEVDIIYGPKGSGKSALYSLLVARVDDLFDRGILLKPAENPRGATVFSNLTTDPPTTEGEFISLWKLYFVTLLSGLFSDYTFHSAPARELDSILVKEGLISEKASLQVVLRSVMDYVKNTFRPRSFEMGLPSPEAGGMITGKITFQEPSQEESKKGYFSLDHLLGLANSVLVEEKIQTWIIIDRLDVSFADEPKLEQNALRALFRVYLDLRPFSNIGLKIFLRTDIWHRITEAGFREASHITKSMTISWNRQTLIHLIARRAIHNQSLQQFYKISPETALASYDSQEKLLYKMCPSQIDIGARQTTTLDWALSRTTDGTGLFAPRELIHLFNSVRDAQIKLLETGGSEPEGDLLFNGSSFKIALAEVSKVRLEQTLYAEYPTARVLIEKLRRSKTQQTITSLSKSWEISIEATEKEARQLIDIGFFEQPSKEQSTQYKIPFLYRDALELIQGTAS